MPLFIVNTHYSEDPDPKNSIHCNEVALYCDGDPKDWNLELPIFGLATGLESLMITHLPASDLWIFFLVLRMCTSLRSLEIESLEMAPWKTSFRQVLHKSYPHLTMLAFSNTFDLHATYPLNWALEILCIPSFSSTSTLNGDLKPWAWASPLLKNFELKLHIALRPKQNKRPQQQ